MQPDKFLAVHDGIVRTVRQVLSYRTKDLHWLDDACQDVLMACVKYERQRGCFPPRAYVATVALNRLCSRARDRNRKMVELPPELLFHSRDEDPAETSEKTEQSTILLAILGRLPPLYREIARLHIVEGWTHEQIARKRMVPINTVKTQFHRAKAFLRKAAKKHFLN